MLLNRCVFGTTLLKAAKAAVGMHCDGVVTILNVDSLGPESFFRSLNVWCQVLFCPPGLL